MISLDDEVPGHYMQEESHQENEVRHAQGQLENDEDASIARPMMPSDTLRGTEEQPRGQ